MKKYISLLIILFTFMTLNAQEAMKVNRGPASSDFEMSDLHKLTFEGDSFYIHLHSGPVLPYSFSALKNLTFGEASGTGLLDQEIAPDEIGLFPNPVKNSLNISIKSEADAHITIINLQGERVLYHTTPLRDNRLDVSQLESGIYLIQFKIGESTNTKMFIKN